MNFVFLSFFVLTTVFAGSDIDISRLIVKVKAGSPAPQNPKAYAIKYLFGSYYIYYTHQLEELKHELNHDDAVASTSYNYKWEAEDTSQATSNKFSQINKDTTSLQFAPEESEIFFTDRMTEQQWGLDNNNGIHLFAHQKYLNENNMQKSEVIVAVIDTGVDTRHVDLKNKIWINKKEIPNNHIDDDNNGYVDDVNGIDLLTRDSQGRATAHQRDGGQGHGTHVSGIIAAAQNNGAGITGISSHALIMPIRAVPNQGDENDADVAEAIIYAGKMGARVVNCSFGKNYSDHSELVSDAIAEIEKMNQAVVVVASGNETTDIDIKRSFPAALRNKNIIVVDAIRKDGSMASFSNFGIKNTDLAAPGVNVLSTTPSGHYAKWSGTSMASPHVAGVAAELLSLFPELTAVELKKIILGSVSPRTALKSKSYTGGIVNLDGATKAAQKLLGK